MPQLHHRDPSIIGLLGSSPFVAAKPPTQPFVVTSFKAKLTAVLPSTTPHKSVSPGPYASEAFDDIRTPPETPILAPNYHHTQVHGRRSFPHLDYSFTTPTPDSERSGQSHRMPITPFERPFYELIVDGIHSHPNSVRV